METIKAIVAWLAGGGTVNPWVPVIVQIALGLITIAGSGVMVHLLDSRRTHKEFLRSKLEALFVAFGDFEQVGYTTMSIWSGVAAEILSYEEAKARDEKELRGKPNYDGTVQMLGYLYFPELMPEYRKCRDIVAKAMIDVVGIRIRLSADPANIHTLNWDIVPRITQCIENFSSASEGFKVSIREYGNALGILKENKW